MSHEPRIIVALDFSAAAPALELVEQLDELVEASFGGPEAERVNERIED